MPDKPQLEDTKRLMGALVRMKPKPHEEMKVGKKAKTSTMKRRALKQKPNKGDDKSKPPRSRKSRDG